MSDFPERRYKGILLNIIGLTRRLVGIKYPEKLHYVTHLYGSYEAFNYSSQKGNFSNITFITKNKLVIHTQFQFFQFLK